MNLIQKIILQINYLNCINKVMFQMQNNFQLYKKKKNA